MVLCVRCGLAAGGEVPSVRRAPRSVRCALAASALTAQGPACAALRADGPKTAAICRGACSAAGEQLRAKLVAPCSCLATLSPPRSSIWSVLTSECARRRFRSCARLSLRGPSGVSERRRSTPGAPGRRGREVDVPSRADPVYLAREQRLPGTVDDLDGAELLRERRREEGRICLRTRGGDHGRHHMMLAVVARRAVRALR